MSEEFTAYVGLGSNLDDPQAQVAHALKALTRLSESRLGETSKLYRTPPWGDTAQSDFINAVARLETRLEPQPLLDELQGLERDAGRKRGGRRWGPRVLDLDLLLYADVQQDSGRLTLPHPRLHQRAFVLVPLLEIAPGIEIPGLGPAAKWLKRLAHDDIEALAAEP